MSRFKFVDDHCGAYEVKRLCQVMEVQRSSYYKWRAGARARVERERADAALATRIRPVHAESDHMRTDPIADALTMAAATRGTLDGAIFHSDHGAQYTSRQFASLCTELGVTQSMGAVGTSADNAACESCHASLKRELLKGAPLARGTGVPSGGLPLAEQVHTWRRHSANGQLSPVAYEQRQSAPLTLAA